MARRGMENGEGPQGQRQCYALGILTSPWELLIPAHQAVTPSITAVSRAEYTDTLSQSCRLLSVCVRTIRGQDPERRKVCKEERSRS